MTVYRPTPFSALPNLHSQMAVKKNRITKGVSLLKPVFSSRPTASSNGATRCTLDGVQTQSCKVRRSALILTALNATGHHIQTIYATSIHPGTNGGLHINHSLRSSHYRSAKKALKSHVNTSLACLATQSLKENRN